MLTEFQFNLTTDSQTGGATCYLLRMDDNDTQWSWLADHEFGPFDTTADIMIWLTRQLSPLANRRLR